MTGPTDAHVIIKNRLAQAARYMRLIRNFTYWESSVASHSSARHSRHFQIGLVDGPERSSLSPAVRPCFEATKSCDRLRMTHILPDTMHVAVHALSFVSDRIEGACAVLFSAHKCVTRRKTDAKQRSWTRDKMKRKWVTSPLNAHAQDYSRSLILRCHWSEIRRGC